MIDLTTKSGKYRIIQENGGLIHIFRHGERWIVNPSAPKMLIELCCELEGLRAQAQPPADVQKRVEAVRREHIPHDPDMSGKGGTGGCRNCHREWPCSTLLLAEDMPAEWIATTGDYVKRF